jgi:serine/threonine-protein kinase
MDEDDSHAVQGTSNMMTDQHNPRTQQIISTALQTIMPGERLHHTYEILRYLKSGGMSEIYLAHHVVLQKDRIVKIIKPELLNNPKILDLFRREASLLSEIRNEAIVSYEGFFQDDKKRYYLVMEYINGPTLAEVIKQRKLTPDEIYILRDRLIYGLMAAHRKGAIHRDLSPDNIILPQGEIGNAKIIDFGIAKDTNEGTIVGDQFVGKFRFSSPEQLRLIDAPVAAYSDISARCCACASRTRPPAAGSSIAAPCACSTPNIPTTIRRWIRWCGSAAVAVASRRSQYRCASARSGAPRFSG